jgi:hypothetical protein
VTVHNFKDSLRKSAEQANAPWWIEVYREAFPDLESSVCVRDDGWAQRGGIDRVLTLASGRTITIDEKVRDADWPDILLEYWSDRDRKTKGWVCKDLACDYIAYAFIPSQTCYLLPFLTLRRVWRQNHKEWVSKYQKIKAQNPGYVTVSVAVPTEILMSSLSDAMLVRWGMDAA